MPVPVQNTAPLYTTFGTSKPSNGFGSSPTVGNSLIAIVTVHSQAGNIAAVSSVVDSQGNSGWAALTSGTLDADNDNVFVWVLPALATGKVANGQTVTFTMSKNCYATVTVYEVPPVNATPLDGSASASGVGNVAQPNSGNLSTTASDDIVFTVVATDDGSAPETAPTGFNAALLENTGALVQTAISWKGVSAPQTNINPTWSGFVASSGDDWSCLAFGVNFTVAQAGGGAGLVGGGVGTLP